MENTYIIAFHYGRGGDFNNGGHINRIEIGRTRYDIVVREGVFLKTDEEGRVLPDEEWIYKDDGGSVVLRGREEIEADTGWLDFDGEYDKYHVCDVLDASEEELDALYNMYLNDDILPSKDPYGEISDYVVEQQGLTRITDEIRFYNCNAEIPTSKGVKSLIWDGCETDEDVVEAWEAFCEEHRIDPKSYEKYHGDFDYMCFFN